MPVVLDDDAWDTWIDPTTSAEHAQQLLVPAPTGILELDPVSSRVSSADNNDPVLLEAVDTRHRD
jgi:putative SOS response-associated peptidase YedK